MRANSLWQVAGRSRNNITELRTISQFCEVDFVLARELQIVSLVSCVREEGIDTENTVHASETGPREDVKW